MARFFFSFIRPDRFPWSPSHAWNQSRFMACHRTPLYQDLIHILQNKQFVTIRALFWIFLSALFERALRPTTFSREHGIEAIWKPWMRWDMAGYMGSVLRILGGSQWYFSRRLLGYSLCFDLNYAQRLLTSSNHLTGDLPVAFDGNIVSFSNP